MGRSIGSLGKAILPAGVALLVMVAGAEGADSLSRWTRFGYDAQRSNHVANSEGDPGPGQSSQRSHSPLTRTGTFLASSST